MTATTYISIRAFKFQFMPIRCIGHDLDTLRAFNIAHTAPHASMACGVDIHIILHYTLLGARHGVLGQYVVGKAALHGAVSAETTNSHMVLWYEYDRIYMLLGSAPTVSQYAAHVVVVQSKR